jgi:hypothetical protein
LKYSEHEQKLIEHNSELLEHFTDHLIIAFSFFCLGMIVATYIGMVLFKKIIKIDYDLEKGTVIRIYDNKGRRWLIVNPASVMHFYDVVLLAFFHKGKEKFIDKQSQRRVRIVTTLTMILIVALVLSGVLLILSAMEIDMNPFNYIFK